MSEKTTWLSLLMAIQPDGTLFGFELSTLKSAKL
jgi:hypothetical protein